MTYYHAWGHSQVPSYYSENTIPRREIQICGMCPGGTSGSRRSPNGAAPVVRTSTAARPGGPGRNYCEVIFCRGIRLLHRWTRLACCGGGSCGGSLNRGFLRQRCRGLGAIGRTGNRNIHFLSQRVFDFSADVGVFLQKHARIFAPLAKPFTAKGNPRPRLFEDALFHAKVYQIAFAGNAFAVEDVKLSLAERRGHLVLHHFGA